jgi:hypothetical protein
MSERFENDKDRDGQEMGAFQYKRHLYNMGVGFVTYTETPEEDTESWDFDVTVNGLPTVALEVRCINYSSRDVHIKFKDRLIIDDVKLNKLTRKFSSINPVTKQREWDKHVIILIRCVRDEVCFAISMENIHKHRNLLTDVPPEFMKHDHGEELNENKKGYYIPTHLMERFI